MIAWESPIWHVEGNNLVIEELPNPQPCDYAWSFKIEIAE